MRAVSRGLLAVCLLPALVGCTGATHWLAGEPAPGSSDLPQSDHFSLVGRASWRGEISRVQSATYLVARTTEEWEAMWARVGREPPGILPDRLMAVGVFIGTRTRTGYQVDIVRIRPEHREGQRDRLVIEYRETEPADTMITGQMLTSPYAIVLIDKTDAPITYTHLPAELLGPDARVKDHR